MANKSLRATYRLQLRPDFTLDDAARLAAYLKRLGVSHAYASPYLQASPGSAHGYDLVDYTRVNRELGGPAAHRRFVDALSKAGMGHVLDMVPNHMAIHPDNPWWWDVLENGPASRYAGYFDVEWDAPETRHSNAVLLPVLGDHYGWVLENGEIRLHFEGDRFTVRYYDNVYPVDPHTLGGILSAAAERFDHPTLAFLAGAFERLPEAALIDRASATRRYRDKEVLREMLGRLVDENPGAGEAIHEIVEAVNGDPDALDAFLRRQNFRLALWKISSRELGYRRFFDINSLIGMRMEEESVFADAHALPLEWIRAGDLDGLRIDHPDGLRDPQGYFARLRAAAGEDAWIVVEKILEHGERLPEDWPVDGTSGYDFLNRVNGLMVDLAAEARLTELYTRFTGLDFDYPALVREKKLLAAYEVLGSDLARLTELLLQICERSRRFRDYTRGELRGALAALAAGMPVYRTYIRPDESAVSAEDEQRVEQAVVEAKDARPEIDPRLFDFLRDLFMLRERIPGYAELIERFQQFTGPVMAKGVEDTTFYIYNRFVSLNEVGGNPSQFGVSPEDFHAACAETQAHWPRSMLTTSTHDTKRSEDVRARLNVLSEIPDEWSAAVQVWSEINAPRRGDFSDRNTEYLFYQVLVGAWPLTVERAQQYMEKAAREAKVFTSWTAPDEAYERGLAGFIAAALSDSHFTGEVESFVARIREAGWTNALAQTLLKLTAPGVPDLYQGSELWDHSLVDPDNRRPVDYALRQKLLDRLEKDPTPETAWAGLEQGLPKLWLVRQALDLRRRRPDLFDARAAYDPLPVRGGESEPAVAYLRGGAVAVVVPRLATRLRPSWSDCWVDLPRARWRNLLTGESLPGGRTSLADLFARFPAALLELGAA